MKSNRTLRLTESQLHKIVKESVRKILKESDNSEEFEYDPDEAYNRQSKGDKHRSTIIFRRRDIGWLYYFQRNWLDEIKETYMLPDVEKGLREYEYNQEYYIKKYGSPLYVWEWKYFDNYEDAFRYTVENWDDIIYLLDNGTDEPD